MLVIGMAGRAGSGKDTAVNMARECLENNGFIVHDLAFADPLKRMYKSFFEGDPYTEDRFIKEQWVVPRTGGKTMRYILQALGTGFGRLLIDPNIWNWDVQYKVDVIREEHVKQYSSDSNLAVLIRDIRFPDEVVLTHNLNSTNHSYVFDIHRFEPKPLTWSQKLIRRVLRRGPHVSETARYRDHLVAGRDLKITNESTLECLRDNIKGSLSMVLSKYHRTNREHCTVATEKLNTFTAQANDGSISFDASKTAIINTLPDAGRAASVLGEVEVYPVMDKQVHLSENTLETLESRGLPRAMVVEAALGLLRLEQICHILAAQGGWWTDLSTGEPLERNVGDLMSLINTEAGEAYDAHRTGCKDSHLTNRVGFDTEIGDMIIRIMDMCGGLGLETVEAVFEKLAYNVNRADHKIENRRKAGGKKL